MTAPSGREASPERPSSSSDSGPMPPATAPGLPAALAGHLLVLMAAVSDSVTPTAAIVAAIACSIIALAALTELAPPDARARRAVTALIGGHGVTTATMLAGVVPGVPGWIPLTGLAAAAALGVASQALGRGASMVNRQPRPLTMAPRVAA